MGSPDPGLARHEIAPVATQQTHHGVVPSGLAEALDGGIRGSRALASVTKLTPLVTIPYITTRRDKAGRKRNIWLLVIAIAVLGIAGMVEIHFFYKPLDLLWFILLRKLNLT